MDIEQELQAIKTRLDELPGTENKLSMVVFSGDLDKQIAAMIIATGSAAMGMKVVLFFTFWATAALRDPKKNVKGKNIMGKMFAMMLPTGRNKLTLSKMHMGGAGTAMMKALMKQKNVANLDQLYDIAAMLGVEIKICEMSMDLMEMKRDEMIDYPNLEYCGVATFMANARDSAVQLFI